MHTVVELKEFSIRAEKLLSGEELRLLLNYISENPLAGVVLRGTGGVRKLRWSAGTKGKSGGVRVIYYVHSIRMPIYLITIFSKGDREDLNDAECNQLEKLARKLSLP